MTRPFEVIASTDTRDCRLYRFWVTHPLTGQRVLGYVGETARAPFVRLMEHINGQPWADLIVAWEVDDRVFAGKEYVLRAEKAAVEAEMPLYNGEWNGGNPQRITRQQAIAQRWARDNTTGRRRWAPPPPRNATKGNGIRQGTPVRTSHVVALPPAHHWKPWQVKVGLWASALLLLWLPLWRLALDLSATVGQGAAIGAVGAVLLLTWGIRRGRRQ